MPIDIQILAGEVVVGTARIDAFDYGMAVAGGDFVPTDAYARSLHATQIEGALFTPSPSLVARANEGDRIDCELVAITDWVKTVGPERRIVELFGIDLVRYFGHDRSYD